MNVFVAIFVLANVTAAAISLRHSEPPLEPSQALAHPLFFQDDDLCMLTFDLMFGVSESMTVNLYGLRNEMAELHVLYGPFYDRSAHLFFKIPKICSVKNRAPFVYNARGGKLTIAVPKFNSPRFKYFGSDTTEEMLQRLQTLMPMPNQTDKVQSQDNLDSDDTKDHSDETEDDFDSGDAVMEDVNGVNGRDTRYNAKREDIINTIHPSCDGDVCIV